MADVKAEAGVGGPELKVEQLGLDAMYSASLRNLKTVGDRDAYVVKDFDDENSRIAPLTQVVCKCSFMDFETGLPQKAFVSVLNELASLGVLQSWFQVPSRVAITMNLGDVQQHVFLQKQLPPADGYALFAMVHVLPEDLLRVKTKYPFIIIEGQALPSWTLERARVK